MYRIFGINIMVPNSFPRQCRSLPINVNQDNTTLTAEALIEGIPLALINQVWAIRALHLVLYNFDHSEDRRDELCISSLDSLYDAVASSPAMLFILQVANKAV